jgi:hypothetical protein
MFTVKIDDDTLASSSPFSLAEMAAAELSLKMKMFRRLEITVNGETKFSYEFTVSGQLRVHHLRDESNCVGYQHEDPAATISNLVEYIIQPKYVQAYLQEKASLKELVET